MHLVVLYVEIEGRTGGRKDVERICVVLFVNRMSLNHVVERVSHVVK